MERRRTRTLEKHAKKCPPASAPALISPFELMPLAAATAAFDFFTQAVSSRPPADRISLCLVDKPPSLQVIWEFYARLLNVRMHHLLGRADHWRIRPVLLACGVTGDCRALAYAHMHRMLRKRGVQSTGSTVSILFSFSFLGSLKEAQMFGWCRGGYFIILRV